MANQNEQYLPTGSIEPPRMLSRLVRLFLGIICLDLVRQIVNDVPGMIERGWPVNFVSICTIIVGFYLLKPVVNLGFTLNENRKAQYLVATVTAMILAIEWLVFNAFWGNYSTAFLMLWMTYVYGHLGISFFISAIIKTPGCEMRALPHLWGKVTGKASTEHHCPAFIRTIDEWEKRLTQ